MTSIYKQILGQDFQKLHPKIQERFGFASQDGIAAIGTGTMEKVWHGGKHLLPFLYIGAWRNIMFPANGENIPFTVENYAYRDTFGRETVSWIRNFKFPQKPRRFDATMILSQKRGCIVDYLGTHQHLAVDIDLAVANNGGLRLRSGAQRFYEGVLGFSFPMLFSGVANVCEWFDDKANLFRIEVVVFNQVWGKLFGYRGAFAIDYVPAETMPAYIKPIREEQRE